MIKNNDKLKEQVKEKLDRKAEEFIDDLNISSETEDFTIDTIEDIMTRFNKEANQIVIDAVNEAIASFDEKKIIAKKKKKLKDYKLSEKEQKT